MQSRLACPFRYHVTPGLVDVFRMLTVMMCLQSAFLQTANSSSGDKSCEVLCISVLQEVPLLGHWKRLEGSVLLRKLQRRMCLRLTGRNHSLTPWHFSKNFIHVTLSFLNKSGMYHNYNIRKYFFISQIRREV